jgi:hypothetical protein
MKPPSAVIHEKVLGNEYTNNRKLFFMYPIAKHFGRLELLLF